MSYKVRRGPSGFYTRLFCLFNFTHTLEFLTYTESICYKGLRFKVKERDCETRCVRF